MDTPLPNMGMRTRSIVLLSQYSNGAEAKGKGNGNSIQAIDIANNVVSRQELNAELQKLNEDWNKKFEEFKNLITGHLFRCSEYHWTPFYNHRDRQEF